MCGDELADNRPVARTCHRPPPVNRQLDVSCYTFLVYHAQRFSLWLSKGLLQMFVIKSMFLPEACCLSQPININLLLRRSEATQGTEVLCQCLDHTRAQMLSLGPYLHAFLLFYKDLCAGKHSWLERMPLISGFRVTSMFSLIMKAGVISTVWNQRPANGLTRLSLNASGTHRKLREQWLHVGGKKYTTR